MTALPRLALNIHRESPFDDAVIVINGHEDETIRIECEGALELADQLIRLVNASRNFAVVERLTIEAPAPADEQQTPYAAGAGIVGQMGELR